MALIEVYEVEMSDKFPTGIKAKFVLVDIENKVPILLIDNHEPFGYHIHSELPHNKNARKVLETQNHQGALKYFWEKVKEFIDE